MCSVVTRNENREWTPWRDFFDVDLFNNRSPSMRSFMPAANLPENDNSYTVDVVAPGYKKEDFNLKVNDNILTISAESKNERAEGNDDREYSRRKYVSSSFARTFRLPDNVKDDAIAAKYNDGILQITTPKSEMETRASKQINIK